MLPAIIVCVCVCVQFPLVLPCCVSFGRGLGQFVKGRSNYFGLLHVFQTDLDKLAHINAWGLG